MAVGPNATCFCRGWASTRHGRFPIPTTGTTATSNRGSRCCSRPPGACVDACASGHNGPAKDSPRIGGDMNAVHMATELSDRLDWLNVPSLRLERLRGRVVALGFWHAGSVLSGSLMRDLQVIQGRHSDGLTVVGIHCPKFDAERERDCVLKAISRLGLRFPMAADPDLVAWQHYGIRGWPCTVLIDTQGRI